MRTIRGSSLKYEQEILVTRRNTMTNAERLLKQVYYLVDQYGFTNVLDGVMNACTLKIYRGMYAEADLRVIQDAERKLQVIRNETARRGL